MFCVQTLHNFVPRDDIIGTIYRADVDLEHGGLLLVQVLNTRLRKPLLYLIWPEDPSLRRTNNTMSLTDNRNSPARE